jgi:transposase InsO family protein
MNDIFRDYIDRFVIVYLDDIVVFSSNPEEHVRHVELVLARLANHSFVIAEKKCQWGRRQLLYLGHIVDALGIRPNPEKVAAITSWPRPSNITEVRGFLNIAGYYRRFIPGFARTGGALYDLLKGSPKKGSKIKWSDDCERAFSKLKAHLTSAPLLSHAKPWQTFVIDSDASGNCIGGVLQQVQQVVSEGQGTASQSTTDDSRFNFRDSDLRPIAYESRRMTPTEQRYSAQEREMLAVDYLLQKFRAYIEGSPIVVRSDHESLKHFLTQRHLGRRLARFADNISHFDVRIIYRPGRLQLAADALSRRGGLQEVPEAEAVGALHAFPLENEDDETPTEPDRSAVFATLRKWKENLRAGNRGDIPSQYSYRNGELWRIEEDGSFRLVPSSVEQALEVIRNIHTDVGHLGSRSVTAAVRERCHIPYVTELVARILRSCEPCQFSERERPVPGPLHPLPRPDAFDRWSFDFVGPLVPSSSGNRYLLTAMDHGTDFVYADAISNRSQDAVIALLRRIISVHGKPLEVLTDNGEEFLSYRVQNFLHRLSINHLRTSPYHPQTNGRLERFNKELVDMLQRLTSPNKQELWDQYLPDALLAHRAHQNRNLATSPFYLTFGRVPRLPRDNGTVFDALQAPPTDAEIERLQNLRLEHIHNLERFRQEANANALRRLEDEASRREDSYRERGIAIGDLVLRRSEAFSKLHPRWDGPFIVRDLTDRNTYQLQTRNGYILRHLYNGERLKRYHPSPLSKVTKLYHASADLQRRDANMNRRR